MLLALAVLFGTDTSLAQDRGSLTPEVQSVLQQARSGSIQQALSGESVPLEGALDPTEYIVGPGDVFSITIGAALPIQQSVTVSADGLLLVPNVGSFDVAEKTLAAVRSEVANGLRRTYRNVNTEIALVRPRQFYVHVAGSVPQPGRHVVAPVARVEDAIAAAMNGVPPLALFEELQRSARFSGEHTFLPALRSIELRRRDGSVETVDLWRYYTSGALRYNPYVRDGDALYVPAFRADLAAVSIEGDVSNPGSYDYRAGDTVLDLLAIAVGGTDYGALGPIRLLRRADSPTAETGPAEARTLDAAAIAAGRADNPLLRPGDRLLVLPQNLSAGLATAVGHVQYPGSYPIENGVTTLQDLVEMAGGLRSTALVHGAYLERHGSTRSARYEPGQPTPFLEIPLDAGISLDRIEGMFSAEISELTRNSALDFTGRQYYGRELLQPQRVSVDVPAVLTGAAPPVYLHDGDRLVVPRDPEAVLVVGQVAQPGYVPFSPGADAEDYIARAGGRSTRAAATYVREASTGRIRLLDESIGALHSGDYVFVDQIGVGDNERLQSLVLQERSLDIQQEQQRAQRTLQYVQTGLTVVSTVAAFLTTYIALTRN